MKKFIIALLVLGAMGAAIGFYLYNKPVASLANKKPDMEIDASQLISDYEADEKKANDKYLGKILQVKGAVADIATEDGKKKIHLATGNPISMITCEIEERRETGDVKAGDEVQIKGLCSGYLSDVILVQCSLIK